MHPIINKIIGFLPKSLQIIALIVGCTYYLGVEINSGINNGFDRVVHESRLPAYAIIRNQIDKQIEKLNKDPDDIKRVDVRFLFEQCSGDFGSKYVPTLPAGDRITISRACSQIEELHVQNGNYLAASN